MSMTKHDYDKIAQVIANERKEYKGTSISDEAWEVTQTLAYSMAETLEANNNNFDRVVFLAKAGIEV